MTQNKNSDVYGDVLPCVKWLLITTVYHAKIPCCESLKKHKASGMPPKGTAQWSMCCKSGRQTVCSGVIPIIRINYNSSSHWHTFRGAEWVSRCSWSPQFLTQWSHCNSHNLKVCVVVSLNWGTCPPWAAQVEGLYNRGPLDFSSRLYIATCSRSLGHNCPQEHRLGFVTLTLSPVDVGNV